MTMVFKRHELPIAYSMIFTASKVKPRRDGHYHFEKVFLLWTAFSNIFTTIAYRKGFSPQLIRNDDGIVVTRKNGNVRIPEVKSVPEREQIALALGEFDEGLKHSLILHASTGFFARRIPAWNGMKIEHDTFGQRLNGVIHVNYTTSAEYPVWSPIDLQVYESYMAEPGEGEDRDFLTKQIVELLCTIKDNLMHLSRMFDDGNDLTVAENALPLLELIVTTFIP